jgi:hypothetical protein
LYDNGCLVLATPPSAARAFAQGVPLVPLAGVAVLVALVANTAFFAGPVVEAYLYEFGFELLAVRLVLFFAETACATLLALAVVSAVAFAAVLPDF